MAAQNAQRGVDADRRPGWSSPGRSSTARTRLAKALFGAVDGPGHPDRRRRRLAQPRSGRRRAGDDAAGVPAGDDDGRAALDRGRQPGPALPRRPAGGHGPPYLRFFAGAPIRLEDGSTPGVFWVAGLAAARARRSARRAAAGPGRLRRRRVEPRPGQARPRGRPPRERCRPADGRLDHPDRAAVAGDDRPRDAGPLRQPALDRGRELVGREVVGRSLLRPVPGHLREVAAGLRALPGRRAASRRPGGDPSAGRRDHLAAGRADALARRRPARSAA